jgi:hypothetical protein
MGERIMTGYVEDSCRDLLCMAGTDSNAMYLLSNLFDAAMEETDLCLPYLRAHCADPSERVMSESLNFILVTFPERIRQWVWDEDEAEAQRHWKGMLGALHVLRHAALPCGSCIDLLWNIGQTRSAEHGPYCLLCWNLHGKIPTGRFQLRVA